MLSGLKSRGFFTLRNQDSLHKALRNFSDEGSYIFFREAENTRLYKPEDYMAFQDSWLFEQLRQGYPFATYQCVPDSSIDNVVFISPNRRSGPLCVYDSIISNELRLSAYFLRKAGGLVLGKPFNEDLVQQFRSKMLAVDGYQLKGKVEPAFYYGRFVLNHGVYRQKRDRLSGLLGLATEAGQKPVFTGEADAAFYDLFGHGVSLYARWRAFQARSQELFAGVELPYLLGTPFVTGFHFGLEKYDTVYTRFRRSVVLRFPASRQWRWSVGLDQTGITGLVSDTTIVKLRRTLPQNAPSRSTLYVASLEKVNLQSAVFPRRGWSMKWEAGIGSRIWLRDAAVSSITWENGAGVLENVYDSLQRVGKLRQTTLKVRYNASFFVPVLKNWVLFFSTQGEEYRAPNINFAELSRWGGINSIRGFNEQRIFANTFHMANLELRFMADQSGFVAPFVSMAIYRNASLQQSDFQNLQSIGLSGGLKTGAGIMKFAWAVGNEGQGFDIRNAKFHLGLTNVF